ncbi:hypothetical protein ACJMK2_023623 [Sinanodonta woodiana]|uniref:Kazal-like domain-containing protein n=1 Tax=Sinanodonta woodiana TaxID=1069815 RepID=A0ABD3T6H7_SINWO
MSGFTNMIFLSLCAIALPYLTLAEAAACCSNIRTNTECRNVCLQLSSGTSQMEQMLILAQAANHCPPDMMDFWNCADSILPALKEIEAWSGRSCCNLTKSRMCSESCSHAMSVENVENSCSRSTEDAFFSCVSRQSEGEQCCGRADSQSCKIVCWHTYLSNTRETQESKHLLRQHCTGRNKDVVQCVLRQTKPEKPSNPADNLHCCPKAQTDKCKHTCIRSLQTLTKEEEIVETMIADCGSPTLVDPLWQCFLKGPPKVKAETGIDGAKLHCCQESSSKRCKNLCVENYSFGWSVSWNEFHKHCHFLNSPIATIDMAMYSCFTEVDEPFRMGCSGLKYCTNFNNHPTELFRRCDAQADEAAKKDIELWEKGEISLPQLKIPVKDIRFCEPEMWKAIACALQIQPFHRKPSPLPICREDCVYILNQCADHSRLTSGQTIQNLCNSLLPLDNEKSCISVLQFTEEEVVSKTNQNEITTPCHPNPCAKGEICHIHRRRCKHPADCKPYVCQKACQFGQVSTVYVPTNTYVVIPEHSELDESSEDECQQYKTCHCGHTQSIGHCKPIHCIKKQSCSISPRHIKDHGSHFKLDCNDCICHAGEKICTKRSCLSDSATNPRWTVSGIQNCDCPHKYEPVCGSNGKTYPSACVARCVGTTTIAQGSCYELDPCKTNPCGEGYRCVPRRQVCLGQNIGPCNQYECIDPERCNHHQHDPVCDTTGEEFTNMCILMARNRVLAYRGHCLKNNYSTSGKVCGQNGETYIHETAALADRTTVDYFAECKSVGSISGKEF